DEEVSTGRRRVDVAPGPEAIIVFVEIDAAANAQRLQVVANQRDGPSTLRDEGQGLRESALHDDVAVLVGAGAGLRIAPHGDVRLDEALGRIDRLHFEGAEAALELQGVDP